MNKLTQKRQKNVIRAIANERLEGLVVSKETRKIAENYVVGKATAKQVASKIRARYGVL
jgi:ATP-dependent protease Clp ATPase subunit